MATDHAPERLTMQMRAEALATAVNQFDILLPVSAAELINVIKSELGDARLPDEPVLLSGGSHPCRAIAPDCILHVFSGNTPHAALQSLVRGLLIGSRNCCKLPSSGLPEIDDFLNCLPDQLARMVETSVVLDDSWLEACDAWIVFGNDDTILHFAHLAADMHVPVFQPHGNKAAFGVIDDTDPGFPSAAESAKAVARFDQQGCLSPHTFYIRVSGIATAPAFAARLAEELQLLEKSLPRVKISLSESSSIMEARDEAYLRMAAGADARVFASEGSTNWTVVCETEPGFRFSPLNRFVYVKPLPDDLLSVLRNASGQLSCCALWKSNPELEMLLQSTGVSRICPLDRIQMPPWTWHQDGMQTIAPLMRWVDLEMD